MNIHSDIASPLCIGAGCYLMILSVSGSKSLLLSACKAFFLSSVLMTNATSLSLLPYEIIRNGISASASIICASTPAYCQRMFPTTDTIDMRSSVRILHIAPVPQGFCISVRYCLWRRTRPDWMKPTDKAGFCTWQTYQKSY